MSEDGMSSKLAHAAKVKEVLDRLAQIERDHMAASVSASAVSHAQPVFMAPSPSRGTGHVLAGRHENILTQSYGL